MMMNRKAQVWVETVIYTLIGLALIGIVLGIVTPKINDFKDRSTIEQTIESLNIFDSKIDEVLSAPGNVRKVEFQMKRGNLFFDSVDNKIYYELDGSKSLFSEPGVEIAIGNINVTTEEGVKEHKVSLFLFYEHNLTFEGDDTVVEQFSSASIPYQFKISNEGFQEGVVNIDISEG
jgi:type II secretory pathway pseudopilin PulG